MSTADTQNSALILIDYQPDQVKAPTIPRVAELLEDESPGRPLQE